MKKILFSLAAISAVGTVQAQSSVTLYGVIDAGVRYTTHTSSTSTNSGANNFQLANGLTQSRFGLKGTEDLGNGLKAVFNLENRFLSQNGQFAVASTSDGSLFNQSWVGLSSNFGTITLGRQYNVVYDTVTSGYASFGYNPYFEAFKPEVNMLQGSRTSNSIKYAANFSGVKIGLAYGLGGQPSNTTGGSGNTLGASLGYSYGPVAIAGAIQRTNASATNTSSTNYTLGGTFTTGPVKVNLGWAGQSTGWANSAAVTSKGSHLNSNLYFGGVTYQATSALNIGGQLYHYRGDAAANTGVISGNTDTATGLNGGTFYPNTTAGILVLDYALSKRTQLYTEADYVFKAGSDAAGNKAPKPFGASVGIRHQF